MIQTIKKLRAIPECCDQTKWSSTQNNFLILRSVNSKQITWKLRRRTQCHPTKHPTGLFCGQIRQTVFSSVQPKHHWIVQKTHSDSVNFKKDISDGACIKLSLALASSAIRQWKEVRTKDLSTNALTYPVLFRDAKWFPSWTAGSKYTAIWQAVWRRKRHLLSNIISKLQTPKLSRLGFGSTKPHLEWSYSMW